MGEIDYVEDTRDSGSVVIVTTLGNFERIKEELFEIVMDSRVLMKFVSNEDFEKWRAVDDKGEADADSCRRESV